MAVLIKKIGEVFLLLLFRNRTSSTASTQSTESCISGSSNCIRNAPLNTSTKRWFSALKASLLILAMLAGSLSHSAWGAGTLVNEPMTGSSALGWVIGGNAYLSASTGLDPVGDGWLRLTDVANDSAGYAFFDTPFDISQGVVIQFDYATWGGTGADGYSIYLFDGSYNASTFGVGATGGSLGYAQKTVAPVHAGVTGGYLGVGIDEFGNYSNGTEGRLPNACTGGPIGPNCGLYANEVGVRGPFDHPSGAYYWLGGSGTLGTALSFNGQLFRPDQTSAQYRKVVIRMIPQTAPNYMSVDVYLQYGYGQPLTQVLSGLMIGRPVPASVKVGYSASTGGSTNNHEIRNLTIDPLNTDINLTMSKVASATTVTAGGTLTYTVTARNYGPNNITASNVPIVDALPALLSSATWTCTGTNGGVCSALSGTGSINTTATLPFNGAVTYAISSSVSATAASGSQIVNTASLTAPSNDYNANDNSATASVLVTGPTVSVRGQAWIDANHNGVIDGGDNLSANIYAGSYAKIFLSSNLTTPLQIVALNATTGAYSFSVPGNANYTVIISNNINATYTPSFAGGGNYIATAPANYTASNLAVGSSPLTNVNFGVYQGTRIDGRVFRDDGSNGGISNANDGVQNASEGGLANVQVQLVRDSNGTCYDGCGAWPAVYTDSGGNFSLYTNAATANSPLRIVEVANPAGYLSVSYNGGTAATPAYNIAGDYITFAYALYTDVTGIRFGDVPDNAFTPAARAQSGTSLTPVYYAHTFTPGSGGIVTFNMNSRSRGTWPAVAYYKDTTCSGVYNAGDPLITGVTVTVFAGAPFCLLVQENILGSAPTGTTDQIVTRATFTFINSVGPVARTYDVTDTTTVINASDLSTSTKAWADLNGGDQNPGDVLQYTITLKETAGLLASNVTVTDTMPPNVTNFSVVSFSSGSNSSTGTGTGANGTGYLNITGISVPPGGAATIVFNVTIANGTAIGTKIDNTAFIANPGSIGATPVAPTVTVSASQVPVNGNKALYLYDGTSTPAYKMSRTRTPTVPMPAGISLANTISQVWTLSPALQALERLAPSVNANVPVKLYLASNAAANRTVVVSLACPAGPTSIATSTVTLALSTTATLTTFNLSLNGATQTCPSNGTWQLTIRNATGAASTVTVYPVDPVSGSNRSQVLLPSLDVINVTSINAFSTAYTGTTVPAYFRPGNTVYTRATVSDPFGSYDITSASITIKDPNNVTVVNNAPMTQVYDSGAASKIYEYAFTTLAASGPGGNWTYTVTAQEGLAAETPVPPSDNRTGTFTVSLYPSITVIKSMSVISDPVNGVSASAKAIPGAEVQYTIQVLNSGGFADADSIVITDVVPAHMTMYVDNAGSAVTLTCGGCGLTDPWTYANTVSYSYQSGGGPPFVYPPTTIGYDPLVTGVRIQPGGTLNGGGASFSVKFKMRIN